MLFEGLAGFLFVVKDRAGRYVSFNASLLQRLGLPQDALLRGRTVTELWPETLSCRYRAQDEWVLSRRSPLLYQLDPILLPGGGANGIALLNNVPLWYEIWRLLNGFPPDLYKNNEIPDGKK